MKRYGPIILVFVCVVLLFHSQSILYSQVQTGSFKFEGQGRNYEVYLPQNFKPNMPLVISLHGYTETIEWYKSYTLLHEIANTEGFITVYPAAIGKSWNSGLIAPGWPLIDTSVNDVGFISALIDTLKAHYDIDMRRVYCCGYSLGGEMTYKLAGELGHRFAAVASITGLINDNSAITCKPVRAFPILHMHGTLDKYETWSGDNKNLWTVPETLNFWLENNGCSIPGDTVSLADIDPGDGCTVEKISYTNCSGEGRLIFYKILNGGHSWPGSAFAWNGEGNKNMDINANVEILNFFKQFENPLVYIPDTAFLYALIEEGVDTNRDSLISFAEAEIVTKLDVSALDERVVITDMTGIEAFVNLTELQSFRNKIAYLDVSNCTDLKILKVSGDCGFSDCYEEGTLTILDVSKNLKLEQLKCEGQLLTSLDISNNTALTFLSCRNNPLTNLDVSNNTLLEDLICSDNQLTSLDVSANTALNGLWCYENQLTNLDVSNNIALEILNIEYMPSLNEVCVWEMPFPPSGVKVYTMDSPNVYFTTECFYDTIVYIPDTAFLYALIDEGVDTNGDSLISYGEAEVVTQLDVSEYEENPGIIFDMTGIESFVNLEDLHCGNNELSNLDVSNNTALLGLFCYGNSLTTLDVSSNPDLEFLSCYSNQLTNLDLSNNFKLIRLVCQTNMISQIDVSNCKLLNLFNCSENLLTSLDVSNNSELGSTSFGMGSGFRICRMPSLFEVCVWEAFNVDSIFIDTTSSPNICFETDCNGECENTDIEKPQTSRFRLFPNPCHSNFSIETDRLDLYSVSINSLNGQLIFSEELEGTTIQLDLSSFQKGVYFITIRSKDFVTTRKIIKL